MSETVSQTKKALMNYTNYNAKVIDRYQTKLVGWTYRDFVSPFDIHTINNIRLLLEALQCGSCFWMRMSKGEVKRHKIDLDKRRAAGETIGKQQPRSDKGSKRPRENAPEVGEGDNDDAPPAKKQKKGRTKKGDKIAPWAKKQKKGTTKKTPKKSKKSQLHPARPTSDDFIASSDDDEV
jgi:hypothetical protein